LCFRQGAEVQKWNDGVTKNLLHDSLLRDYEINNASFIKRKGDEVSAMNLLEIRYKSTWRRRCQGDVIVICMFFNENARLCCLCVMKSCLWGGFVVSAPKGEKHIEHIIKPIHFAFKLPNYVPQYRHVN